MKNTTDNAVEQSTNVCEEVALAVAMNVFEYNEENIPEFNLSVGDNIYSDLRTEISLLRYAETLQEFEYLKIKKLDVTAKDGVIDGIEKCKNLEELTLRGNLEDLSLVAQLEKLKKLDLRLDNINDLTPLKNLHDLEEFSDSSEEHDDLDLSPLANMINLKKLTFLSILGEGMKEVIGKLKNLEYLCVYIGESELNINDLMSELKNLKKLVTLISVEGRWASSIEQLKRLETLSLRANENDVINLPNLRNFKMNENTNGMPSLKLSKKLEHVHLSRLNDYSNISELTGLPNLKSIVMETEGEPESLKQYKELFSNITIWNVDEDSKELSKID